MPKQKDYNYELACTQSMVASSLHKAARDLYLLGIGSLLRFMLILSQPGIAVNFANFSGFRKSDRIFIKSSSDILLDSCR